MRQFIRGGQTSLHAIRMIKQILTVMMQWGTWFGVIFIAYYAYSNIDEYSFYIFCMYLMAQVLLFCGAGLDKLINVSNPDGILLQVKLNDFIYYPSVLNSKAKIILTLITGVSWALLLALFVIIIVVIIFAIRGKKLGETKFIRGSKIDSEENIISQIQKDNKKLNRSSYKICNINYPADTESLHTIITGGSGTGKSVTICDLIDQIKKKNERAIIYDKMGVFTQYFYDENKDILLNPLDSRMPNWDIFKEGRKTTDFDMMAAALIPSVGSSSDPFWVNTSRILFAESCAALSERGDASNEILLKKLLTDDIKDVAELVKGTPAQSIIDLRSPKTALSVLSVLSTYLRSLKYSKKQGDNFSIRDWVNNDDAKNMLFITSRGDQHATLKPLISTWIEIAINSLLSLEQSRDRKIWIILDELPSLHSLPSLQAGLAESRQFGGAFVLSLQLMAQLRDIYGRDGAESVSGLCRTRVVFGSPDEDTAKWCSNSLGNTEIEEFKEGLSFGAHEMRDGVNLNVSKTMRHLVLPSEIMNLANLNAYVKLANNYPVAKIKLEYVVRDKIASRFIEDSTNKGYF